MSSKPRFPPGPTIPASGNLSNLVVNKATISDSAIGFFGKSAVQQNADAATLESVVQLLQAYGLCAPNPWTQQGSELLGGGTTGLSSQGTCALSSDGNTLVIGGQTNNTAIGAIWIFIRSGTTWTEQAGPLIGTGYTGTDIRQGYSVAISADGNTVASGGINDNTDIGAVWIFTRTGTVWSQQGLKLVGTGYTGTPNQGLAISLSYDGNTLAIGGNADDSGIGGVWIFTRSAGVWTQEAGPLIGSGATGAAGQGSGVALNSDGNTLAIGGPSNDSGIGGVWIFTRSAGVWTEESGGPLSPSGTTPTSAQGYSVALSSDGDTLVYGGNADNDGIGACWAFTRSAGVWTQQGLKLVGSGYSAGTVAQGTSISISADGNTFITGAFQDNNNVGAAWIFVRSNGIWSQSGFKLVPNDYTFGTSPPGVYIGFLNCVSISNDATTVAVGGIVNDDTAGGTWIFIPRS